MARKASRKDLRIVVGTVLAIPICENRWALAQVLYLGKGPSFYLAVSTAACIDPAQAQWDQPAKFVLFSWTNDAEVYKGRWKNIGVHELPERMPPVPEYKLSPSDDMSVWSFDDRYVRPFDEDRDGFLNYKTSRSPLMVENAAKAMSGVTRWLPHLEDMKRP